MRKIAGLFLVALVGFTFAFSGDETKPGISFNHMTVADAMKESQKTGKLIFIDCYTSWCGPCKRMAATSFLDEEVGKLYNANFINLKVEMEKDAEGPELARKYRVAAYPTLLIIDGKGNVVQHKVGMQDVAGLKAMANAALN